MTVRFFMLQSHYSSTLDFSNEALIAAEKGFRKLTQALSLIKKMNHPGSTRPDKAAEETLAGFAQSLHTEMSDDFNTARTLAVLFEMASRINDLKSGNLPIAHLSSEVFEEFKKNFVTFMEDVLGLKEEQEQNNSVLQNVVQVLIDLRKKARQDKNFALSDKIRDDLKKVGVQLKDGKEGEIEFSIDG